MATADRSSITILPATREDVPDILRFIRGLAEYEKLSHACVATEEMLLATLFGDRPAAEVLIARLDGSPAGFALFFSSYSTFRAKPGIYLEDLFVLPDHRGRGVGKALLVRLAQIAQERDCAPGVQSFERPVLEAEHGTRSALDLGPRFLDPPCFPEPEHAGENPREDRNLPGDVILLSIRQRSSSCSSREPRPIGRCTPVHFTFYRRLTSPPGGVSCPVAFRSLLPRSPS